MKQFLLKSWLMLVCLLLGGGSFAWAETYTITFKTGTNDGTSVSTSTDCSVLVSEGSSYLSGKLATANNVYNAGGSGLKLGTSGSSGKLKMNLSEAGKVHATSVVVRAKQYNSTKPTKLALNGNTAQDLSGDFADYTFALNSDITYLELISSKGTSGGAYCWIESITVNYTTSGGDTPTPTTYTVTVANGIVNGTVTASPTSAKQGDEITLTATPSTGYEFGSWNVTNASTSAAITVTNNKFKMPAANVNVSATFNEIQGGGEDTPTGSLVYKKVTSQDDIVDGGVYIIVCESQNTAMGSQNTNRRNNASITISDNSISLNSVNTENSPYEVTLTKDGDIYKMQLSNNNYLGNGAGNNNYLKEVQNYAIGYGWTLTYNTDKTVTMKTNHTTARYLCVNTANADSYATYTSIGSYEKVTLYKKETSTPDNPVDPTPAGGTINFVATTGDGKYYATFSSDRAIKFDEAFINDDESCAAAIKAYAIAIVGGQIYRTDQCKKNNDGNYTYIPANTGILFEYSLEEGTFDGAVPFEYADAEAAYLNKVEDNMLVPCPTTGACPTVEGNNYYYKLAYGDNTNKTKLGFWWGANDGSGNFKVKAGGAVLCVPQSAGAKLSGFVFGDEDANSINNIPVLDMKATIYNLNGQRVSANAKGIVIVNGKKVLNK